MKQTKYKIGDIIEETVWFIKSSGSIHFLIIDIDEKHYVLHCLYSFRNYVASVNDVFRYAIEAVDEHSHTYRKLV